MDKKLPVEYIAGFTEGEGCFALKFRKMVRKERKGAPVYFMWSGEFAILLHGKDEKLLEKIRETIGCGSIKKNANGSIRYQVQKTEELKECIIPFFKNKLHGSKAMDFKLWQEAIEIIYRNKRKKLNLEKGKAGFQRTEWDKKDLIRLVEIQKEMKNYKGGAGKEWKWIKEAPGQ
ncbi:MAG: LAGLIDADG family homing endonuclease [Candidatus Paceibacterota bacterium]